VDPVAASRLHPHDVRRVVRALEVWELTRRPISAWQQQWQPIGESRIEDGGSKIEDRGWPADRCLRLDVPRQELYARIDGRVREMMANGWLEEARRLRQLPKPLSREASQALGYKEIFAHLEGQGDLEQSIQEIQTRSRNFAKRQISWLRHLPECRPVNRELTFRLWG